MAGNKPVRFIRKKGRIIPIYSSKNTKNSIEGTFLTGAGVGSTIGGSYLAGRLKKASARANSTGKAGSQMFKSVNSFRPDLKDFRIRSNAMGKLVNMGGKAKAISHGQINLFGPRGLVAKEAAHAFALKSKVSAYKKAFLSRKFLKYSHNFAHASVGLGVDKLIELTGLEASIGNEYASEMAGVISFGATSSLGNSVFDKAFKGKSIRKSLASDAGKFLSKNKGTIINIGKKLIRKRFKF